MVELGRLFCFDDVDGLVEVLRVVLFGLGQEYFSDALQIGH